jgi:peptidoglycan/LPS O-acetylase OafA/YrhL
MKEITKRPPDPAASSSAALPLKMRAVVWSAWVLLVAFWALLLRFTAYHQGQVLSWAPALVLSAFGMGMFPLLRNHVAPRWPRNKLGIPAIPVVLAALILAMILSMTFAALLDLVPYLPSGVHVVAQLAFVAAFIGLVPPMRTRTARRRRRYGAAR